MKVLHVINSFKYAGAEVLVRNLITGIRRTHPSVHVEICIPFQRGFWADDFRKLGITVHDLGLSRWNVLGTLLKLKILIQHESYDIVHVHLWPSLYYLAMVSKMARLPLYLFTEHNTWNARRKYRILRFVEARAYSTYHTIICNSHETQLALLGWVRTVRDRVRVVENGVPVPEFHKTSYKLDDPVSLIIIGRLMPQKGMDIAIKAVRLLGRERINVMLTIIGDGPEYSKLAKIAAGLPVRFISSTANPGQYMLESDILIMPSRWEGFGLTAIEASMIGLPVIASRIDALARIIEDRKTGLLCNPEDATDLSLKIKELISNDELREVLSTIGRETALRNWGIERFIKETIDLYYKVLSLQPGGIEAGMVKDDNRKSIGQLN